jgi:hypothetical protein
VITVRPPRLPGSGSSAVDAVFGTLVRWATSELGKRTPDDTVRNSILLRASDEGIWEVTISDLGVLTTTQVSS